MRTIAGRSQGTCTKDGEPWRPLGRGLLALLVVLPGTAAPHAAPPSAHPVPPYCVIKVPPNPVMQVRSQPHLSHLQPHMCPQRALSLTHGTAATDVQQPCILPVGR